MRPLRFISRRISATRGDAGQISAPMVRISTAGVAVGIAVMLVAISVVIGFKREIRLKITGFTSDIHLVNFDLNASYDADPVDAGRPAIAQISALDGVRHMQRYATKPGIIRHGDELQAIILKGVGHDFDTTHFARNIQEGNFLQLPDSSAGNGVVVSRSVADKLGIEVGDRLPAFFMQQPIRSRNFTVAGIYTTGLEMHDDYYVLCDIRHIQRLNGWRHDQVAGFEIFLDDSDLLESMTEKIDEMISLDFGRDRSMLRAVPVTELYQQVFDWLQLQDMNVYVIIILMILVSGINMAAGLLILILERTRFIGIMKTLGMNNRSLRAVFRRQSLQVIGRGLIIGNAVAAAVIGTQHFFAPLKLDPASYYLTHVPVAVSPGYWLLINVATLASLSLLMRLPAAYIARIPVASVMRME